MSSSKRIVTTLLDNQDNSPQINYDVKTFEKLLYTTSLFNRDCIQPVLKFVFLTQTPEDEKTETHAKFSYQLKVLNDLRIKLKAKHACFIASEPSTTEITKQQIAGIITDKSLLIVNPLGSTGREDFYAAMQQVTPAFSQQLYLSSFPIQQDSSSDGIICIELARHFAELTAEKIDDELTKNAGSEKTIFGLKHTLIDISQTGLVPDKISKLIAATSKAPNKYEKLMSFFRQYHVDLLKPLKDRIYYDESLLTAIITEPNKDYTQDDRYPRLTNQIAAAAHIPGTIIISPVTRSIPKGIDKEDIIVGPNRAGDSQSFGPDGASLPIQYGLGSKRAGLITSQKTSDETKNTNGNRCLVQ